MTCQDKYKHVCRTFETPADMPIEKRKKRGTRFFHASPRRFKVGDILVGKMSSHEKNVPGVFMTSTPVPHYTIFDRALNEAWHVYEVVPMGPLTYGSMWDEMTAPQAQVVRYVGNARGIASGKKHGSLVDKKRQCNIDITQGQTLGTLRDRVSHLQETGGPAAQRACASFLNIYRQVLSARILPEKEYTIVCFNWKAAERFLPQDLWEKFRRAADEINDLYASKAHRGKRKRNRKEE